MKTLLPVLICTVLAWGQRQEPSPSPEEQEIARLLELADLVKSALANHDLATANRLATELTLGTLRHEKALKLAQLEAHLAADGSARFYALARVANAAYEALDYTKAEVYARELLSLAPQYPNDWNYCNAIFYGNMVLGRVALQRDSNISAANAALIAAGRTPGSQTLKSFGPNMSLAKDLLEAGERESVLRFFDQCRAFWRLHGQKLDDWAAAVKSCRKPDFGANLVYLP